MSQKIYLTKEGLKKIKQEYLDLKKSRLAEPTKELLQEDSVAIAEKRMTDLEFALKNVERIKLPPKDKRGLVDLGATVFLEDHSGKINKFTIVGTLEAEPRTGKISSESPVGKALLNHKICDEISIIFPIKINYKIRDIKYQLT